MSKFVITLKQDLPVPREDLRETLSALVKELKNPELESVMFNLHSKAKRNKVQVNVIELPLTPIIKNKK